MSAIFVEKFLGSVRAGFRFLWSLGFISVGFCGSLSPGLFIWALLKFDMFEIVEVWQGLWCLKVLILSHHLTKRTSCISSKRATLYLIQIHASNCWFFYVSLECNLEFRSLSNLERWNIFRSWFIASAYGHNIIVFFLSLFLGKFKLHNNVPTGLSQGKICLHSSSNMTKFFHGDLIYQDKIWFFLLACNQWALFCGYWSHGLNTMTFKTVISAICLMFIYNIFLTVM